MLKDAGRRVRARAATMGGCAMDVESTGFFEEFTRLCESGYALGWHEGGAGNLSYRLSADDLAACADALAGDDAADDWRDLDVEASELAGAYLLVSASGAHVRDIARRPRERCGIVHISECADAWRCEWGFEHGARPTSEFPTHVLAHGARLRAAASEACRVVYHAHCPHVTALSTLLAPDSRTWTRVLWRQMTECIVYFPEGVGVVGWMVPGGSDIAYATAEQLAARRAVVWTQHGLVATGASFDDVFALAHGIEKAAGMYLEARAANGGAEPPHLVSDAQLRAICDAYGVCPEQAFLDDDSLI